MNIFTFEVEHIPALFRNMYRSKDDLTNGESLLDCSSYPVNGKVIAVYKWSNYEFEHDQPEIPKGHVGWLVYLEDDIKHELYKAYVHMSIRKFINFEFEKLASDAEKSEEDRRYPYNKIEEITDIDGKNTLVLKFPTRTFQITFQITTRIRQLV